MIDKQTVRNLRRLINASERLPRADPRRGRMQRQAARLVAEDPSVVDDPSLASQRQRLRQWARLVPYLVDEPTEGALLSSGSATVANCLADLAKLELSPTTSLAAADRFLEGLDSVDAEARADADLRAHGITDARAAPVVESLVLLTHAHVADDRQRGIADWRLRWALVQGTEPVRLQRLLQATRGAQQIARRWYLARQQVAGHRYCDRRCGLAVAGSTLAADALAAGSALASSHPALATAAERATVLVKRGVHNEVAFSQNGTLTVTVRHQPTGRGRLMVAHELGHAVHALRAKAADPPGALVGETIACWTTLTAGCRWIESGQPDRRAMALALGDVLIEELFVSAVVSGFEDELQACGRGSRPLTVDTSNATWLTLHRDLYGDTVQVPDEVGSGWARLSTLAIEPGHAVSYVWATILASAIAARHPVGHDESLVSAIDLGGIDADHLVKMLGFRGDEWIEVGLQQFEQQIERLIAIVATG